MMIALCWAKLNSLIAYSQHIIFLLTYEWEKEARVLHYIMLEKLATLAYGVDSQWWMDWTFEGLHESWSEAGEKQIFTIAQMLLMHM